MDGADGDRPGTLAVASLVNFYVGYLVLEGALPGRSSSSARRSSSRRAPRATCVEASEAAARTEQGLTETADQMRSQVSDASEKIRALETRIVELQTTRASAAEMAVGAVSSELETACRGARRGRRLAR